jgi:hypothetical protein
MLVLSSPALAPGQTKSAEPKKGAPVVEKEAAPAAADQCAALTQSVERCKRKAQARTKYCWPHDKAKGAKGKADASKAGTADSKKQ